MIAITGATGFIGSNLAQRLARDGADLLLVDPDASPERLANLRGVPVSAVVPPDEFLQQLESGGAAPYTVFHLGACSSTIEVDWNFLAENNIHYSQRLWRWCAAHERPFIYASSAATYGDGSRGFDDRTPPASLQPLNLYGKSKNDFDAWALAETAAARPAPPRWAGLKFFNVYGPRELHKGRMASVVWHARRQIIETGEMRLFRSNDPAIADGEQRRDFVFVEDCIDHMLWLWRNAAPNAIYNSGTGAARTFLDLTHAVFSTLGREPRIVFIDMPADVAGQYQNCTQADMTRLRQAGYNRPPPTTLEEGVARTLSER
ncbi:MAG: ADP-glyceromanno-heptose 6-epimerase [Phycisphaerae bacterium]|jgi:ADP-L-glycero-D-manno-heptose 6-epimerase